MTAREYLVVEQLRETAVLDRTVLTAQALQDTLNCYAIDGWALDRIVTSETARAMGFLNKDVLLLIFSREISAEETATRKVHAEKARRQQNEVAAHGGMPWG